MIRGAIEVATREAVQGWIYSPLTQLFGHTILAFIGPDCVGSGAVDIFREDLKSAGLGDGWSGFHFGVTLPDGAAAGAIVIRLEGSDAAILQRGAIVMPA